MRILSKIFLMLSLLVVTVSSFAVSEKQCIQDADSYRPAGGSEFFGPMNVGKNVHPQSVYGAFDILGWPPTGVHYSINYGCGSDTCVGNSSYGSNQIKIDSCSETADTITLKLSGPTVASATAVIPKGQRPAPSIQFSLTTSLPGLVPASDKATYHPKPF